MAKINNQPPRAPIWPWGGPRSVRERLVDPAQFNKKRKTGDPKNPALPSAALLDFIGPAHSSEAMRLPMPPPPLGHDADLEGFQDRAYLGSVAERAQPEQRELLEQSLARLSAPPERVDRLKVLLQREAQMLNLVGQLHAEIEEIQRRIREEQADEGY
jgi:hypothetical protein